MSPVRVSGALLARLGEPASTELIEVLDAHHRASTEAVMTQCAERFERRLVEETSKIRVEMSHLRGDLRSEIGDLRGETRQGFADIRRDMANDRFDLLRWAFVFWVGQLVAMTGIVGLLLRTIPARQASSSSTHQLTNAHGFSTSMKNSIIRS